jgi:hypothetical protein
VTADAEIEARGFQILCQHMGNVDAERFIALIRREPFDYTEWRRQLDLDLSIRELSDRAMASRNLEQ